MSGCRPEWPSATRAASCSRRRNGSCCATALGGAAGTGSVTGNLAAALPEVLAPAVLALIRLVIARDELRARLRTATGSRIPLLSQSTALVAGYLAAERGLGRIAAAA